MAVQIDASAAEKILKGIKIPPQPQIMVDIEMEMVMPDFDIGEISKLVAKDVGLSGSILKTVNSSFFGLKKKVTSIHQAISLLGVDSLTSIINAISIRGAMSNADIVALNSFWDNSMDIAAACAYIAKQTISTPSGEAYTLGLFHNSAIPLMMQRYDNYQDVMESSYQCSEAAINSKEVDQLGTDHCSIGFFVASAWKLPKYIGEAIAQHHDCEEVFGTGNCPQTQLRDLLAVLKIAEHLCKAHRVLGNCESDYEFERLKTPVLTYLGLTQIDLENLADDLLDLGTG
ncbi:HDOD domain-containing protein [Motiliproteus sp. MSK22-1]|uniref:HDOD domain-containing protein n=1 Tax=Motiliproteus sp. MSK22-1 TaxID=1897630 RepID=UPI00097752E4|nr:HDOD domain-containing protein [Motiliproteus sp. MSK22-1]OMH39765.1 hypothetical protein BGP75_01550 [Motiliproteus sp. MSK22-1]